MAQLKQGMSTLDVVALGISAAVGVSIFSVIAPATLIAGPAMLLSLAIAAVPMVVFVVIYAFMGSAVPRTGASYDWPAQFVHPYLGFIVAWARILGCAGGLHLMASVFVGYLAHLVALPRVPVTVGLMTIFFLVNLFGVGAAGQVARALVLLKLVALVGFIAWGLPHVETANFVPLVPGGALSVLAALPLLVGLYTGIESAAEAGEEIKNSRAAIGKGLAIATVIGMLLYLGTSVVSIGVLGPADVSTSTAPLSLAAERAMGSWVAPLLVMTALVSIAAAINTLMLIFSRFLFAMGRDSVLPESLARIHPRWGTPHVALTVVYICGLLSLLLPESLVFLFLASNLPTMLKYGSNCLAASRLVDRHPALHAGAGFRMSRRSVKVWSYFGMVCAAVIILAGLRADLRPYLVLLGWCAAGTAYWLVRGRHHSDAMANRT